MILSEDRQVHLAHVIVDGLWKDDIVDYSDDDRAMHVAKQGVAKFVREVSEVDSDVRRKIESLKRNVLENTPEWDVMYSKYFEEELVRRGNK